MTPIAAPIAPPPEVAVPLSAAVTLAAQVREAALTEVRKAVVGQDEALELMLCGLIAGGHVLLEGKPGLGKTHLVLALAATFGGQFRRIQFTPDLMPGDVTGHTLYDMGRQEFRLKQGPVFCNLLPADEINRAPAKTQAALLEVMQENQVTIDGQTLPLSPPFMTLATQNPIEQEGTYPLPEAQLDRFLMKVQIDYPNADHEEAIVAGSTSGSDPLSARHIQPFATAQDILQLQAIAARVACVPEVIAYAVRLVRATRGSQGMALGAGTRGAIALVKVAKAFALLTGRTYVTPDDIKSAALPVLRHRVALAPELAISGQRIDDFLTGLLRTVEAPR